MKIKQQRTFAAVAALVAMTVMTTACSSGTGSSPSASPGPVSSTTVQGGPDGSESWTVDADTSLYAQVPDTNKSSGVISIATDPSTAPFEFLASDGQTLVGADIDLGNAIAARLGLKAEWNSTKFPGIITAIQAKRYDTAMASMGDTLEREKVLDFVDYSTDANSIVVQAGNPKNISTIEDLCGTNVAALEGSIFLGLLQQADDACATKMTITTFQDINSALMQVTSGRADATIYQAGVAAYLIKTSPDAAKLEVLTTKLYGEGYNAAPFNKDNTALRDAFQAAAQSLVDDGTYKKILDSWGLKTNQIDTISVNDGARYDQPS